MESTSYSPIWLFLNIMKSSSLLLHIDRPLQQWETLALKSERPGFWYQPSYLPWNPVKSVNFLSFSVYMYRIRIVNSLFIRVVRIKWIDICLAHSKSTGNTSYYNHLLPLLEIIMGFKSAKWVLQLRDLGLPKPIVDSGHHFLASSSGRFHITSNEKYILASFLEIWRAGL